MSDSICRLSVRARPQLYVMDHADRSPRAYFRFALAEVLLEAANGHCRTISVTVDNDFNVCVADDGRPYLMCIEEEAVLPWMDLEQLDSSIRQVGRAVSMGEQMAYLVFVSAYFRLIAPGSAKSVTVEFEKGEFKEVRHLESKAVELPNRLEFQPDFDIFEKPGEEFCDSIIELLREKTISLTGLRISFAQTDMGIQIEI